jgi:hypothetical protein
MTANYPTWLHYAAALSLGLAAVGLVAACVSPGPVTGALFPLGMGGLWLTARALRPTTPPEARTPASGPENGAAGRVSVGGRE